MKITLSQAIEGFMLASEARRLSPHTLLDYGTTLRKLQRYLSGDPVFAEITAADIRGFLASMTTLSKKTLLNYHTGLSAMWTWAVGEGVAESHVLREVERPRPESRAIVPLSEADVRCLLAACDRSLPYSRPGKRVSDHARSTALRDKTIIFLLLDTGLRASELCGLRIRDVDIRNRRITVWGKGAKERILPISPETSRILWRYLSAERADVTMNAAVFMTIVGTTMNRFGLLNLLNRMGRRASVAHVHPHRFRHTFAINFLRNGGNALALQMALGHSTLEMVKTYVALAATDLARAHEDASPVRNWRLQAK